VRRREGEDDAHVEARERGGLEHRVEGGHENGERLEADADEDGAPERQVGEEAEPLPTPTIGGR
jgi:hypothetical protein